MNTTTGAQRHNARQDKIWAEAKRLKTQTRFNASSRERPAPNKAQHSPQTIQIGCTAYSVDALRAIIKQANHADKLAEVLTWIKEVVSERKGTALWLQMVEDKTRNALRDYEAAQ